jgi:hypothetical protein
MKCFTPTYKALVAPTKIPSDDPSSRTVAVREHDHGSRTLAVRTGVHGGGPACGYQCLAYRKCLGDNDDWAALNCDM